MLFNKPIYTKLGQNRQLLSECDIDKLNYCYTYSWPGSDIYSCNGNTLVQHNYSCSDDCGATTNGESGCQDYVNTRYDPVCCP